ncbi:hypothetical protein [Rhodocaloribacter sp.]
MRSLTGFLVLTVFLAWPSQAQEFGRVNKIQADGTAYHVFAQAGEATIQVLVLGAVNAGIYEVRVGTDLEQLIALTGTSMTPGTAGESVKYTVRLFRDEDGRRTLLYEAPLEKMLMSAAAYPSLQEGDVVMVEGVSKARFGWRDALTILTSLTTVALLVERLSR